MIRRGRRVRRIFNFSLLLSFGGTGGALAGTLNPGVVHLGVDGLSGVGGGDMSSRLLRRICLPLIPTDDIK